MDRTNRHQNSVRNQPEFPPAVAHQNLPKQYNPPAPPRVGSTYPTKTPPRRGKSRGGRGADPDRDVAGTYSRRSGRIEGRIAAAERSKERGGGRGEARGIGERRGGGVLTFFSQRTQRVGVETGEPRSLARFPLRVPVFCALFAIKKSANSYFHDVINPFLL